MFHLEGQGGDRLVYFQVMVLEIKFFWNCKNRRPTEVSLVLKAYPNNPRITKTTTIKELVLHLSYRQSNSI